MSSNPKSATCFIANVVALAAGLAVIWTLAQGRDAPVSALVSYLPMLPCVVVFIIIAAAECWLRGNRRLGALDWSPVPQRAVDYQRVGLAVLGLLATLSLIALAYWLFPEYHGDFYQPYWQFLSTLAPLIVLVPPYFIWADRRTPQPRDEFVELGRLVIGQWREVDRALIQRHLLGWTVKAFFLPLMTVYLNNEMNAVIRMIRGGGTPALLGFDGLFHVSYTIDLLFCVVGYTATMRWLGSHMRSVEPTTIGWVAALICYQPFYSVIGRFYLPFEGPLRWDQWLAPWPMLRGAWGAGIVALCMFYALATVAFGIRFSNLTHRGIITSGPYRYSKHPAYLSKNLSWWLISVPLVAGQGWPTALRHCLMLLLLNAVYFLRARTEERHLSRDANYVAYAQWVNEHGLLSGLGRVMPWLRYRPPAQATAPAWR